MTHISFQRLIDYLEDRLSAEEAAEVSLHLARCDECQHSFALARQFLTNMRGRNLEKPKAGLLRRAIAAFRQQQQRLAHRTQQTGALRYDNWQDHRLAGARGLPGEHQLLYQAAGYDVDLQITHAPASQSYVLRGQILTTGQPQAAIEGSAIRLTDEATIERGALADHLGQFQFSYLHQGAYTLTITAEAVDIVIRSVQIGAEAP